MLIKPAVRQKPTPLSNRIVHPFPLDIEALQTTGQLKIQIIRKRFTAFFFVNSTKYSTPVCDHLSCEPATLQVNALEMVSTRGVSKDPLHVLFYVLKKKAKDLPHFIEYKRVSRTETGTRPTETTKRLPLRKNVPKNGHDLVTGCLGSCSTMVLKLVTGLLLSVEKLDQCFSF